MNKEILNGAYAEIDHFRDKLAEILVEEVMADDNLGIDMAKSVISTFMCCQTEREFVIANYMLAAVCGWSFETLVEKIKERDAEERDAGECIWGLF